MMYLENPRPRRYNRVLGNYLRGAPNLRAFKSAAVVPRDVSKRLEELYCVERSSLENGFAVVPDDVDYIPDRDLFGWEPHQYINAPVDDRPIGRRSRRTTAGSGFAVRPVNP
jgi:hypothetical protein